MQDSFARARTRPKGLNAAARPSARATIGYLVYNERLNSEDMKSVKLSSSVVLAIGLNC